MKLKFKIPLVILFFLIVLGIASINFYTFNARETEKSNNNTNLSNKIENNIIDNKNLNSSKDDANENSLNNNIIEDNSESIEENKIVNDKINDVNKNNIITSSNTKVNDNKPSNNSESEKVFENNTIPNNEVKEEDNSSKDLETNNDDITNEKQDNNKVIIEVPDEGNKDNISSFENDEEYIKLKSTLEFETREECNQASDIIGPKYAREGNLKNTACESFAYKGTVIGFRLKIYFKDGTWIYNN